MLKKMMERIIKKKSLPENLNPNWDILADCYFQKREFLCHLHKYNPCAQRYYELYRNGNLVAGAVVYTLKVDIFTFANIRSPFLVQIIGMPVSIATPPVIGDPGEFEYLLSEIINIERGLIIGLNFIDDYLQQKVLNLRTLPTLILKLQVDNMVEYEKSLRYTYRRRIRKFRDKFANVIAITADCSAFSAEHYSLYLQIMKRTTTKLETLSYHAFKYLPSNFTLTTYYDGIKMLCWNVVCYDNDVLIFFFGGMDYQYRDQFQSYHNSLLGIISAAIDQKKMEVEFGQTAETAKSRFGGILSERKMFLYHGNPIIFGLLKLFRKLITYSKLNKKPKVFKVLKNIQPIMQCE
jgi:hypothetical protein